MALLTVIKDTDPTLRKISRPVDAITPHILTLLDDMTETMRQHNGCGLAAVQVGVLRRIVVIEVEEGEVYEMINPEIIDRKGHQEETEGCLSIPGRWGITDRPMEVTVRYQDRTGEYYDLTGDDLLARAICHEVDHLDGKLFTDVMIREISPEEAEQ